MLDIFMIYKCIMLYIEYYNIQMNVRVVEIYIYLVLSGHMTYSYWSSDRTYGITVT